MARGPSTAWARTDDEDDPRSGIETEGGTGGEDDGAGTLEDPDE